MYSKYLNYPAFPSISLFRSGAIENFNFQSTTMTPPRTFTKKKARFTSVHTPNPHRKYPRQFLRGGKNSRQGWVAPSAYKVSQGPLVPGGKLAVFNGHETPPRCLSAARASRIWKIQTLSFPTIHWLPAFHSPSQLKTTTNHPLKFTPWIRL